jgi:AraC family transcriptional regulator, regulatory protein of adaptative response / DNA-3-methyladenine glycosylase II
MPDSVRLQPQLREAVRFPLVETNGECQTDGMTPTTLTAEEPLEAWMRAAESRDPRFDGWITVGVTSTGIYCRPSCPTPVRPKRTNMLFFRTPAGAQAAGFRACKRCAPDATPGSPEWNRRDDLVARAIRGIDDGMIDRIGVSGLAEHLAVSSRHLHRLMASEIGATPLGLARARRARAARILIETTDVPFSDVAFAAGFDSIRQFNDTVREVFAMSPTTMRGKRSPRSTPTDSWISLRMPLRPPYDAAQVLGWLESHAIGGVEEVAGQLYRRSLQLPGGHGVAELTFGIDRIDARFRLESLADLQPAIQRCRRLLDLDADPVVINDSLAEDIRLAPLLAQHPGIRSPGDVTGIDTAIRAVVHQQVSVASARSVLTRLLAEHGDPLEQAVGAVDRCFPDAASWAELNPDALGLPKSRAATLVRLAAVIADGTIDLSPAADREQAHAQMLAVKGIGPWTASIVGLRALCDPDVFVPGDLALVRVATDLGLGPDSDSLAENAERWRPWRSYVMHHLWAGYMDKSQPSTARSSRPPSNQIPNDQNGNR